MLLIIFTYINLMNKDLLSNVIDNAIMKVRAYEPNSLIRERADVFVRIHVVPTEQLIRVSGGKIEPTAYILDTYVIGNSVVKIREYLNNHEFGKIRIGKLMDKTLDKDPKLITDYIALLINVLRTFQGYLICRHVLDHIVWAYDEVVGENAMINRFRAVFPDDRTIDKALNETSKFLVTEVVDFYNGLRRWVQHGDLRKPSYTQYLVINTVLESLRNDENLVTLEANEDYYYLGIIKGLKPGII